MILENIFKLILLTSLMGTVVALIIFLVKAIFKNNLSSTWHYYIWLLLIVRLIMPYSVSSSYSIFNLLGTPFHNATVLNLSEKKIANTSFKIPVDKSLLPQSTKVNEYKNVKSTNLSNSNNTDMTTVSGISLIRILSIIWGVGALTLGLYFITSYYVFKKKLKFSKVCSDKHTIDILNKSKASVGVSNKVSIIYSEINKSPALFGITSHKILIPVHTFEQLSVDEKKYVFMHELIHLKRHDILVNWLKTLLICLHWFNPIIWIAFNKMKKDCEISCDSEILKRIDSSEYMKYGETLIKLIKTITQPKTIPGTTAIINGSEIKRRIIMISKYKKATIFGSILAITITALVGFTVLTNIKSPLSTEKTTGDIPIASSTTKTQEVKSTAVPTADISKINTNDNSKNIIVTKQSTDSTKSINSDKNTTTNFNYQKDNSPTILSEREIRNLSVNADAALDKLLLLGNLDYKHIIDITNRSYAKSLVYNSREEIRKDLANYFTKETVETYIKDYTLIKNGNLYIVAGSKGASSPNPKSDKIEFIQNGNTINLKYTMTYDTGMIDEDKRTLVFEDGKWLFINQTV